MGPDYPGAYDFSKKSFVGEFPRPVDSVAGQHDAHIIPKGLPGAGNVLIYDNQGSAGFPPVYLELFQGSRVIEVDPTTKEIVWQYDGLASGAQCWTFMSFHMSNARRLPNGNTLICEGSTGRIFEVTMDQEIVWEFVNPAAEQLTARSANVLIGKRLSKVMPEAFARGLFNVFCNTVETGTPWRRELYYPDNGVPRWFRFTVARVGDGFAVSFQDVTARKQAELQLHASQQRQRTILDGIVSMIGLTTPSGILLEINEASLRLTGAASQDLVGKPIWQHPAWSHTRAMQDRLISAFAKAEAGRRMRFDAEIRDSRGLLIPVDVQLAPIFDESGQVTDIVMSAVDISERKRAEAHREMLLSELNHRVKNSLATIQAIAAHTLREATDFEGFRQSFTGRLRAIAASHDLLVSTTQDSSDISRLIRDQVLGYAPADGTRLEMTGPPLVLGPQGSHAFGLILHELATNASKYGAFSNDSGRLSISWFIEETDDDPDVIIDWVETDGPPVVPPSRKGFGSVLIEQSLSHALGGKSNLTFDPKGLKAQFRFPARR